MAEFLTYLIIGFIGFLIGGAVGEHTHHAWFPYAWYGLAAAWGVCICAHCGFDFDY